MKFKFKPFNIDTNQFTGLIEDSDDLGDVLKHYKADTLLNFKKSLIRIGVIPTFGVNSEFEGERLVEFLTEKE